MSQAMNSKNQVLDMVLAIAEVYGKEFSESRAKFYTESIFEFLKNKNLTQAYKEITLTCEYFPTPKQIADIFSEKIDPELQAKEAAARIIGAVRKFGWANPKEAKIFIGSLGWEVVELNGGWQKVAESMNNRDIPILSAQFRDLALSQFEKHKKNIHQAPQLPENKQVLNLINSSIKKI